VQETFLKVFRNLHEFSPSKASFKTWLMTIARNQSINTFASLKRRAARFLRDVTGERYGHGPEEGLFEADQSDPEELVSTREQMARVEQALKQLPERQRTALQLKVLENMSYEEIARIMRTSKSSVESLIFRARQKLLELLED
jgi:RNA polymerase sigma-70 factor (ECF subfamily)